MAHMGCSCGNNMWDGDGTIVYDVYFKSDIEKYLEIPNRKKDSFDDVYERSCKLNQDLLLDYRYYFWLCNKCKKVHLWNNDEKSNLYRQYEKSDNFFEISLDTLDDCEQIYPLNINEYDDTPIVDIISTDKKFKYKYYVTKDLLKVYIFNDNELIQVYNLIYESDLDLDLQIKSVNDCLVYTITKNNDGHEYKVIDGKKTDTTKNDYPHREVHFMMNISGDDDNGHIRAKNPNKKPEIYNKYNMDLFYDKYGKDFDKKLNK